MNLSEPECRNCLDRNTCIYADKLTCSERNWLENAIITVVAAIVIIIGCAIFGAALR